MARLSISATVEVDANLSCGDMMLSAVASTATSSQAAVVRIAADGTRNRSNWAPCKAPPCHDPYDHYKGLTAGHP